MAATLFDDQRLSIDESISLSAASLGQYGPSYSHWVIAYSGGKDSSATVALVCDLIERGLVKRPQSLTVLYADTRQELPPLHAAAMKNLERVRQLGHNAHVVCAPMARRFWPYILGRGVPSPNNGTFRWCTEGIKVAPMTAALRALRKEIASEWRVLKANLIWQVRAELRAKGEFFYGKKAALKSVSLSV